MDILLFDFGHSLATEPSNTVYEKNLFFLFVFL